MTKSDLIDRLKAHERELRSLGVARLSLFGSVARGDASPASDLDVVVDIAPGRRFSIIDHGSLRVRLCEIAERETDVVIRNSLRPSFAARIAPDTVDVF